jgi:hypothetical protein
MQANYKQPCSLAKPTFVDRTFLCTRLARIPLHALSDRNNFLPIAIRVKVAWFPSVIKLLSELFSPYGNLTGLRQRDLHVQTKQLATQDTKNNSV